MGTGSVGHATQVESTAESIVDATVERTVNSTIEPAAPPAVEPAAKSTVKLALESYRARNSPQLFQSSQLALWNTEALGEALGHRAVAHWDTAQWHTGTHIEGIKPTVRSCLTVSPQRSLLETYLGAPQDSTTLAPRTGAPPWSTQWNFTLESALEPRAGAHTGNPTLGPTLETPHWGPPCSQWSPTL